MKELDRLKRFVKFDKSFSIDGTHLHIAAWALSEIECLTAENDRLAALEAVQTAEPVAWVDMEHLNDMREHAERTGRWQTVIAATAQNVPNKVPLYATPQQAAAPAGMQLVPIEPTREMINSAIRLFTNAGFADIYKAMLKAAPKAGGVS